jgi:hypothetical protein
MSLEKEINQMLWRASLAKLAAVRARFTSWSSTTFANHLVFAVDGQIKALRAAGPTATPHKRSRASDISRGSCH